MDNKRLDGLLRGKTPGYLGTFSRNTLPEETGIFVSNIDPDHLPGTHWVAIYIDGREEENSLILSADHRPAISELT